MNAALHYAICDPHALQPATVALVRPCRAARESAPRASSRRPNGLRHAAAALLALVLTSSLLATIDQAFPPLAAACASVDAASVPHERRAPRYPA